jgi:hypothetical protein
MDRALAEISRHLRAGPTGGFFMKRVAHSRVKVVGTYTLRCRIEERGPGSFLAIVMADPEANSPPGLMPELESRLQETREDAFRACAEMGFAMEARFLRRGLAVRGWPPRRVGSRAAASF